MSSCNFTECGGGADNENEGYVSGVRLRGGSDPEDEGYVSGEDDDDDNGDDDQIDWEAVD